MSSFLFEGGFFHLTMTCPHCYYDEVARRHILIFDLLAQLGEHYLDRVGVSGSSPLQIIEKNRVDTRFFVVYE